MFNIFKKKNKTKDIVNPIDNIKINDYKDLDTKELELVDNLIEEYKILFKEIDSIIDIDKDIYNEFKMYQELIINIVSNLDTNNTLDSIISLLKLKVYFDELNNIYDKLKYKLIALKEIKNNKDYIRIETLKYYLGKRKININSSLSNYINNISISLLNIYTLINIVNKEIINLSSIAINTNIDDYKNKINSKLNNTNNDYTLLFNNELNIDNNLTKLILEEIELEKFAYLNKDKKQELLNKIDEISNSEIKDKDEQQEIINNLIQIKTYFNIFNTYGRNIIKEEDLNELYRIIFNTYTYFAYDCDDFITYYNSAFGYEKDYYNKIIEFKKEMLIQGKSPAFNNIDSSDKEDIINLLNDCCIRKNVPTPLKAHVLSLLLYLEEENGLEEYFKNTKNYLLNSLFTNYLKNRIVPETYTKSLKLICSLTNNKNISLYDFYKLYTGLFDSKENTIDLYDIYNSSLYKVFRIIFKDKLDFNIIPEGITKFDTFEFKKYLNNCDENKHIILPDSVLDVSIKNDGFYVLPKEVNNLYVNNITSGEINKLYNYFTHLGRIIMPIKINESCTICNKEIAVNLIHRKEILEMNDHELRQYLLNIYSQELISISGYNPKEIMESSYNKLNKILGTIYILDENTISIPINYESIKGLWGEDIYFLERINAIINCIINDLYIYRNYSCIKINNIDKNKVKYK